MLLYSIMDADLSHLDEICADIKRQYQEGISNCVLFLVHLVPEGDPVIDKATLFAQRYIPFRDKLAKMGLTCGILVQCTLGHGYPLDKPNPFTRYENLTNGEPQSIVCPYDLDARAYFKDQLAKIAALRPSSIMIDGDFRLMSRSGKGCACPLHMAAFRKLANTDISRAELFSILQNKEHPHHREYTDFFVQTQRESLVDTMKAMREGIDSIDPRMHAVCCNGGSPANEFSDEFAKILAGIGNPSAVRVGNGNYTHEGPRHISAVSYRLAQTGQLLRRDGVDMVLEEGDTCPHNRYSTSAQALHTHHIASILEGASGTKHWITRLGQGVYEPKSGEAYRKILAENSKLYDALYTLVPKIRRIGCRIPLPTVKYYGLDEPGWYDLRDGWSNCVLERFGVPLYFSMEPGGAAFLEGNTYLYTDDEILQMLKGPLFLASDAAQELCQRGFGKYLGVEVRKWTGAQVSYELLGPGKRRCSPHRIKLRELVPTDPSTAADSVMIHLQDGKDEIPLFPGVTVYRNSLGGTAICFAGSPKTPFTYFEAFAFLTEARKEQIIRLLEMVGVLPVYHPGDEEVYMNAGETEDGSLFTVLYNIGLDPISTITLCTDREIHSVRMLDKDGSWQPLTFVHDGGNTEIRYPLYTLEPVILLMD